MFIKVIQSKLFFDDIFEDWSDAQDRFVEKSTKLFWWAIMAGCVFPVIGVLVGDWLLIASLLPAVIIYIYGIVYAFKSKILMKIVKAISCSLGALYVNILWLSGLKAGEEEGFSVGLGIVGIIVMVVICIWRFQNSDDDE